MRMRCLMLCSHHTYCMSHNLRKAGASAWSRCRSGFCRGLRRRWSAHHHSSRAHRPENGSRASPCRLGLPSAGGLYWRPWWWMRLGRAAVAGIEDSEVSSLLAPPTRFSPLPQISYLPASPPSASLHWWHPVGRWPFGTILVCKNTCFGLVHLPTMVPNASHVRLLTRCAPLPSPCISASSPVVASRSEMDRGTLSIRCEAWHVVMPPFK
jgi:hypothetical protein